MINLLVNGGMIENIELVIFDKDGTLMDLYTYWSGMIDLRVSRAQAELGLTQKQKWDVMYEMGVDLEKSRLRPEGPVGLKKREIVMQAMIKGLERNGFPGNESLCQAAFSDADRMSLDRLPALIKPIRGMNELITALRKNGCKLAVGTTDKTERARLAMGFLGIKDKIDMVVGEDMVPNYKPSPDMVDLILRELSVDRKCAVMVGDAITDVEMGIKARLAASIGVCSGLTSREMLSKKTRFIAKDVSEIKLI
ncbi:MAG: HAD family hydrolase [Candidatus Omnitrophica bacterium]|nr:HAD family hydrolase [Candidatus Omnitrophota bacterium]